MMKSCVFSTPLEIVAVAVMLSKAKPSLNISRKSSVMRRGSACRLSMPSNLPMPGSILRNWPFAAINDKSPASVG